MAASSPAAPAASDLAALHSRRRFWIGLLLGGAGAILFSAKAIVAKLAYRYHVDAVTFIAFRMLFAVPIFASVAWWCSRRQAALPRADRWRIVGLGLVGYYLSSFLDFVGLQYITAALERLILFLTPTMVLGVTAFWLKRRISGREWLALALAYAGIVLVFAHDLSFGGAAVWIGSACVFASALSYATYLIGSGELVKRVGAVRLVAYAMCVSSVAVIAQFFLVHPPSMLVQPVPVYWLSLINAIFCTVLPVFMTMMSVARVGAPTASQMGMIGPISTLFLGYWILAEPVTGWQLSGTALVLTGIFVLSRKK
jgi:drug/metabolite transporter (DMT)-like permease